MRNVWPARTLCFVHFAVWKERKIWAKVEIVLLTSWDVRWCVIYRIHVVHGGTRYIYHRIKVSIEVFVDNPVITALEAPAGSPWWKILLISLYCCDSLERGVHRSGQSVAQAGPVHHLVGGDGRRLAAARHVAGLHRRHGRLQLGLGGGHCGHGGGRQLGHQGAGHRVLDPATMAGAEGGQGVGGVPVAGDGGRPTRPKQLPVTSCSEMRISWSHSRPTWQKRDSQVWWRVRLSIVNCNALNIMRFE